jgi:hypothetical protein
MCQRERVIAGSGRPAALHDTLHRELDRLDVEALKRIDEGILTPETRHQARTDLALPILDLNEMTSHQPVNSEQALKPRLPFVNCHLAQHYRSSGAKDL